MSVITETTPSNVILRNRIISLIIAVLLYAVDGHAQSQYSIPLPKSIVPIDIISIDGDYIQIISQNGIYEVNGTDIGPYMIFDDMDLVPNVTARHLYASDRFYPSYPVIQGGYVSIINKDSIVRSKINASPSSIKVDDSGPTIGLNNRSIKIENDNISVLPDQTMDHNNERNSWINSIINHHNISGVIKTYTSHDSTTRVLTKEKLYTINHNELSTDFEINTDRSEEIINFYVDNGDNVWLLTHNQVIIITPHHLHKYDLAPAHEIYKPYKIRDKLYCSNGLRVMQKYNEEWHERNNLKAPQNVTISGSGDTYLIYENRAEKLSKDNAQLIETIDRFRGELIEDINTDYVCTSESVYKNRVKISQSVDQYYKSIIHNDQVIILGQSGIYTYTNGQFRLLKSTQIPQSKNYFIQDGHVFYFSDNTIHHIEIENPENEGILVIKKSKILDFISDDNHLIILTTSSVLYIDKELLLRDRVLMDKVIPISPRLTDATLSMIDGDVWISTRESLTLIDADNAMGQQLPALSLIYTPHHYDISTTLKSNNFYSDKINYTYYINTSEGSKTIWTKDPDLTVERDPNTDINIIAKMNDDVFAQDIYSNDVTISATKSTLLDRMIKIMAAILATLLILWAIRKWITS